MSDDRRQHERIELLAQVELRRVGQVATLSAINISAGGVLFYMDSALDIGSIIEFTISMPASVLGTATDVIVKCSGRVVRCSKHGDRTAVAAVIDEYHFDRSQ